MPKKQKEKERDKSVRGRNVASEESVATDYDDDGRTLMTGVTQADEEGGGGGKKGLSGGLRGMARVCAWVDIGFISVLLLILFLTCILALLTDNTTLELEIMTEGTGVFATLMVLMMTLEVWHDSGLITGTRPDEDPAVCIVYTTFWIVYTCSQLVVSGLVLIVAVLSLENYADNKFKMSKPEALATVTLSTIACIIRVPCLVIVGLYLRKLKGGGGSGGDGDYEEEGELTESQLQMSEEQSESGR